MPRELQPIRRFTQADVAVRAGVSRATVSAVINGTRYVSLEVAERIREAMAELAYEPNAIARGLKFRRTFTLGLLLPNIQSPFWPAVVRGIEEAAREHQYNVLFYSTEESLDQETAGLGLFLGQRVDGMLVAPSSDAHAEYLVRLDATSIPVVLLDRRLDGADLSSVTVDNRQGAYTVVRHLLETGRRRIAVVTIPETISTGRDRVAGYEQALRDFGVPVDRGLIRTTSFAVEESYAQTLRLFALPAPPDAIFATNHSAVIGALQALKTRGVAVPDEVAIVGFDDHPWMSLLDPPLTTVSQPMHALGVQATELLLQRIEHAGRAVDGAPLGSPDADGAGGDESPADRRSPATQIVLPTTFVHRRSCGCAAG